MSGPTAGKGPANHTLHGGEAGGARPLMSDAQEALGRLDAHARELDELSSAQNKTLRELEPVEREYQDFIDAYEVGLYLQAQEDGSRVPAQAMQQKLARKAMKPELLGRRDELLRRRERYAERIRDLRTLIDAERSILVAEREAAMA